MELAACEDRIKKQQMGAINKGKFYIKTHYLKKELTKHSTTPFSA